MTKQGHREIKGPVKERTREVRTPLERYTLIKRVGQGGSGFAVAARNEAGVSVALKYLGTGRTSQTVESRRSRLRRWSDVMDRQLLTPDAAVDVFTRLLAEVRAAHEANVWHRDLKPENILISDDLRQEDTRVYRRSDADIGWFPFLFHRARA